MEYPRRDRWGRPLIVPELAMGTDEVPHTRATTVAKALNGFEGLSRWQQRMAVGGAALRPDILAQVAAAWPPDNDNSKAAIDGYVEQLREAAAASAGANAGDAFHTVMARVWRGEPFKPIPPFDVAVKVIDELFQKHGLRAVPEYVERTVVLPEQQVAGSFDLLVEKKGQLLIADLKTGRDLEMAWPSISIQLSLYSRAKTLYDWETRTHFPMPQVNRRQGLVIWLPAFSSTASLHVIDLEAGWEAARQAMWVREWRSRKNLARTVK